MFLGLLRPNPFISDMTDISSNKRYLSSCRWVKCEPQNPQNNRQEELKRLFNLFAWAALVFAKIKLGGISISFNDSTTTDCSADA